MKNFSSILSISLLLAVAFGFSSCKEDEPPAKPKLSFAESELTVGEGDGSVEVEVVLDKPHSKDLNIEYELGGTASDQDVVGTANADYQVDGDHGVVVIESGETTGIIKLDIISDAAFEPDETIEISILDTNTDEIELTAEDEMVITITNDDVQLVASMATASMTVNEADGTQGFINVTVNLNQAPTSDATITYTLDGSAIDSAFAVNYEPDPIPASYYDYKVKGTTAGQLVIPAGATSGNIEIRLFSDFMFESDETIEITLTATNAVEVGTSNKTTITVQQQDGKAIALVWDEQHTDVDMDMFLWVGPAIDNYDGVLATAITPRTTPRQEVIFIPTVIADEIVEAAFGLSLIYYSGTAEPMNFEVHFVDFVAGELEAAANTEIFAASYTLANRNAWDQSDVEPVVVQTFRIVNGEYVDISEITVPASGSRVKGQKLPQGLERRLWFPSKTL